MKFYRISWVEEQHIIEVFKDSKKEAEVLKGHLIDEGLYPYVTCDYTENFDNVEINIKKAQIGKQKGRNRIRP